ncbi:hypothetical protein ACJX0J_006547, partial [Zea mays]
TFFIWKKTFRKMKASVSTSAFNDYLFWFRSHTAKEIKWGGTATVPIFAIAELTGLSRYFHFCFLYGCYCLYTT